jgi:hypothetical protein
MTKIQLNLVIKLLALAKSQHRTKELVVIDHIQNVPFVLVENVVVKQAHRSTCNAIITIVMSNVDF